MENASGGFERNKASAWCRFVVLMCLVSGGLGAGFSDEIPLRLHDELGEIRKGLEAYKTIGSKGALSVWGDDSDSLRVALQMAELKYGGYDGSEFVYYKEITERDARALFAIFYQSGSVFLLFNLYGRQDKKRIGSVRAVKDIDRFLSENPPPFEDFDTYSPGSRAVRLLSREVANLRKLLNSYVEELRESNRLATTDTIPDKTARDGKTEADRKNGRPRSTVQK